MGSISGWQLSAWTNSTEFRSYDEAPEDWRKSERWLIMNQRFVTQELTLTYLRHLACVFVIVSLATSSDLDCSPPRAMFWKKSTQWKAHMYYLWNKVSASNHNNCFLVIIRKVRCNNTSNCTLHNFDPSMDSNDAFLLAFTQNTALEFQQRKNNESRVSEGHCILLHLCKSIRQNCNIEAKLELH